MRVEQQTIGHQRFDPDFAEGGVHFGDRATQRVQSVGDVGDVGESSVYLLDGF